MCGELACRWTREPVTSLCDVSRIGGRSVPAVVFFCLREEVRHLLYGKNTRLIVFVLVLGNLDARVTNVVDWIGIDGLCIYTHSSFNIHHSAFTIQHYYWSFSWCFYLRHSCICACMQRNTHDFVLFFNEKWANYAVQSSACYTKNQKLSVWRKE